MLRSTKKALAYLVHWSFLFCLCVRLTNAGGFEQQQRRPLPAAETGRSCWGCGQQDARAAQGTMQPLGAATRAPFLRGSRRPPAPTKNSGIQWVPEFLFYLKKIPPTQRSDDFAGRIGGKMNRVRCGAVNSFGVFYGLERKINRFVNPDCGRILRPVSMRERAMGHRL